jgi:UDP-N-acetylglucosamine 1-carboxyvinyltransferase
MSEYVIHGGKSLSGELTASGNKNAILPMLAATLLTDEEVVLENVPEIRDVAGMLEILAHLGADVSRSPNQVTIRAANLSDGEVPVALCEKIRTSFLVAAPLLYRLGHARLYPPGGDQIGRRRLDSHFYGLRGVASRRRCSSSTSRA